MARQPLTNEQLKILEEFHDSHLTGSAFAKERNISVNAIYYLIDKERDLQMQEHLENNIVKLEADIIKEEVISKPNKENSITLKIGNISIDLKESFNEELLIKIIKVFNHVEI